MNPIPVDGWTMLAWSMPSILAAIFAGWATIISAKAATKKDVTAVIEEVKDVHDVVNGFSSATRKEASAQAELIREATVSSVQLKSEKDANQQLIKLKEDQHLLLRVLEDKWQVERDAHIKTISTLEKQLLLKQQQEHPDRDPGLLSE